MPQLGESVVEGTVARRPVQKRVVHSLPPAHLGLGVIGKADDLVGERQEGVDRDPGFLGRFLGYD